MRKTVLIGIMLGALGLASCSPMSATAHPRHGSSAVIYYGVHGGHPVYRPYHYRPAPYHYRGRYWGQAPHNYYRGYRQGYWKGYHNARKHDWRDGRRDRRHDRHDGRRDGRGR